MQAYLGIKPQTDDVGCMQDTHWPSGQLGYFPAYANGAIIASMLMQTAQKDYPTMDAALREGNFNDLNNFLTENLRRFGALKSSSEFTSRSNRSYKDSTHYLPGISKKEILVGDRL